LWPCSQDALVHALWKFDELTLFKVMVMKAELDDITTVNKSRFLGSTIQYKQSSRAGGVL
jgi:hypothetical protein